jgi:hypothetical protein
MPREGRTQRPAGKVLADDLELSGSKTMRVKRKGFTIDPQQYKGNSVLNANK